MTPEELLPIVQKYSKEHGVDPQLVLKILAAESSGRSNAESAKGALGLMQLMPATATEMGVTDPLDPDQNIRGGTKYLSQMQAKYPDPRTALAAYNFGPTNIDAGKPWPTETVNYVNKIMGPEQPPVAAAVASEQPPLASAAAPKATYEQVVADPDFAKFSPEAQVRIVNRLVGPEAAKRHQMTAGPVIGPATSPMTPELPSMADAFERTMQATGISGVMNKLLGTGPDPGVFGAKPSVTTPITEDPYNERDAAQVIRGLGETAAAGMAPLALGAAAGLPATMEASAVTTLPAWKTVLAGLGLGSVGGAVGGPVGHMVGDALGVPETGRALGEQVGAIAGGVGGEQLAPLPESVPLNLEQQAGQYISPRTFLDKLADALGLPRASLVGVKGDRIQTLAGGTAAPVAGETGLVPDRVTPIIPGQSIEPEVVQPAARPVEVPAKATRGRVMSTAQEPVEVPPSAERVVKTPQEVAAEGAPEKVNLAPGEPAPAEVAPAPADGRAVASRIAPEDVTGQPVLEGDEAESKDFIQTLRRSLANKNNESLRETAAAPPEEVRPPQAASGVTPAAAVASASAGSPQAASAEPPTDEALTARIDGKEYRVGEQIQSGVSKGKWVVEINDNGQPLISKNQPRAANIPVDVAPVAAYIKEEVAPQAAALVAEPAAEELAPAEPSPAFAPPPRDIPEGAPRRKKIAEMNPEEMRQALAEDRLTGLGSKLAYEDAERLPVQAKWDAEGLKATNDNLGDESGNELLRAVGTAFREEGLQAYRMGGDEFVTQHMTHEEAADAAVRVKARLQKARISATLPDGTVQYYEGIGLHHGAGDDYGKADTTLRAAKKAATDAGERAERGVTPTKNLRPVSGPVDQVPAQGHQAQGAPPTEGAPVSEEVAPAPEAAAVRPKGQSRETGEPQSQFKPIDRDVPVRSPIPNDARVLASHTDKAGYKVEVLDHLNPEEDIMGRAGTMRITSPDGKSVRSGYWMDLPEDHWGLTEKQYAKLSPGKRAALEAEEQATRHDLKHDFEFHKTKPWNQGPAGPEPKYSVAPNELGFYSQLERVAADPRAPKAAKGADWVQYLNDPKRSVKKDEMRWSGLDDYLDARRGEKVTKEDIQTFLKENNVEVKEITKGVKEDRKVSAQEVEDASEDARNAYNTHIEDRYEIMGELKVLGYPEDRAAPLAVRLIEALPGEYTEIIERFDDPHLLDTARESYTKYRQAIKKLDNLKNSLPAYTPPKYAQYQLPGGTNYREVLLQVPPESTPKGSDVDLAFIKWGKAKGLSERTLDAILADPAQNSYWDQFRTETGMSYLPRREAFSHGHWPGDKNIVGHFRLNDRIDADGKKTLFAEEVQGDWGQAALHKDEEGVKRGFKGTPEELKGARAASDAAFDKLTIMQNDLRKPMGDIFSVKEEPDTLGMQEPWALYDSNGHQWGAFETKEIADKAAKELAKEARYYTEADMIQHVPEYAKLVKDWEGLSRKEQQLRDGVLRGPFVEKTEDWTSLVMRRLLRMAAEGGYDRLSWTTGEQQVDRWQSALRKAVDTIHWKKTPDGVHLVGEKNGYDVVNTTEKETVLSDSIGKAMSDQILSSPEQSGTIKGEGIKISDTGMASFYDKILPRIAEKVAKKWGAKTGQFDLNATPHKLRDRTPGQELSEYIERVVNDGENDESEHEILQQLQEHPWPDHPTETQIQSAIDGAIEHVRADYADASLMWENRHWAQAGRAVREALMPLTQNMTQIERGVPDLHSFDTETWRAFQGAEDFPSGHDPLYGDVRVMVYKDGDEAHGRLVDAILLVDRSGLSIYPHTGDDFVDDTGFNLEVELGSPTEAQNWVTHHWGSPDFWPQWEQSLGRGNYKIDGTPRKPAMVHSIDLTPEMREGISREGFPQFALNKRKLSPLGFYSKLRETIEAPQTPNSGKGSDLARFLADPKRGVKAAELKWTGINEYLQARGSEKVTKDDLLRYLDEHQVEVKEVQKGQNRMSQENKARLRQLEGMIGLNDAQEAEQTQLLAMRDASIGRSDTKYGQYTLPGGDNYREVVLTLPQKPAKQQKWEVRQTEEYAPTGQQPGYEVVGPSTSDQPGPAVYGEFETQAEAQQHTDYFNRQALPGGQFSEPPQFTGGHMEEANALGWFRLKDRTDADGKKVLFVEEVQSDWAQKARRDGISRTVETSPDEIQQLEAVVEKNRKRLQEQHELRKVAEEEIGVDPGEKFKPGSFDSLSPEDMDRLVAIDHSVDTARSVLNISEHNLEMARKPLKTPGVPDAPFIGKTEDWSALMVKRILRMAAEEGYDRVAWTTGDQQADRYDLSKQISSIHAHRLTEGHLKGQYAITAWDNQRTPGAVIDDAFSPEKLPDIVGKELADKIISQPRTDHDYTDLDLKVGGEGMKGFYDKILPATVEKVGKQWGVKVGKNKVDVGLSADALSGNEQNPALPDWLEEYAGSTVERQYYEVIKAIRKGATQAEALEEHASPRLAELVGDRKLDTINAAEVHSIDITPEMRDSITSEGFSQFKMGESKPHEQITLESIKANLPEGLPQRVREVNGKFTLQTPAGSVEISPVGEVVLNWHALEAGHGDEAVAGVKAGAKKIIGSTVSIGPKAYIQIVQSGALPHEFNGHVFLDHFATPKEKALINRELKARAKAEGRSVDEVFADGSSDWFKNDRDKRTEEGLLQKVYRRIYEFFAGIYHALRPNLEGIYRDVARGKPFERKAGVDGAEVSEAASVESRVVPPEERDANFKKWFGDSKVVDENGEPLQVYHGTRKPGFDVFETTESHAGSHFATEPGPANYYGAQGGVLPVHLKIENPWITEDLGNWDVGKVAESLADQGLVESAEKASQAIRSDPKYNRGKKGYNEAIINYLKSLGFDGIKYLNRYETGDHSASSWADRIMSGKITDAEFKAKFPEASESWVAFEPSQIKSATGNAGTFSDKTGDIRYDIKDFAEGKAKLDAEKAAKKPRSNEKEMPPPEELEDGSILLGGRIDLNDDSPVLWDPTAILDQVPHALDPKTGELSLVGWAETGKQVFLKFKWDGNGVRPEEGGWEQGDPIWNNVRKISKWIDDNNLVTWQPTTGWKDYKTNVQLPTEEAGTDNLSKVKALHKYYPDKFSELDVKAVEKGTKEDGHGYGPLDAALRRNGIDGSIYIGEPGNDYKGLRLPKKSDADRKGDAVLKALKFEKKPTEPKYSVEDKRPGPIDDILKSREDALNEYKKGMSEYVDKKGRQVLSELGIRPEEKATASVRDRINKFLGVKPKAEGESGMSRREFLGKSATVAAGAALPGGKEAVTEATKGAAPLVAKATKLLSEAKKWLSDPESGKREIRKYGGDSSFIDDLFGNLDSLVYDSKKYEEMSGTPLLPTELSQQISKILDKLGDYAEEMASFAGDLIHVGGKYYSMGDTVTDGPHAGKIVDESLEKLSQQEWLKENHPDIAARQEADDIAETKLASPKVIKAKRKRGKRPDPWKAYLAHMEESEKAAKAAPPATSSGAPAPKASPVP